MKTSNRLTKILNHNRLTAMLVALALTGGALLTTAAVKPPNVTVSDKPVNRNGSLPASLAPIVKKVAPSVVNIYSTRKVSTQRFWHPFMDDPALRRFFGGDEEERPSRPQRTRKIESLGSGVIISEDGYILSNHHVVDGADDIRVALAGDKTEYVAKLIGSDPQTDVAVLKIEAKKLTPIVLADSDQLEVGDFVMAVGNPFNVGQTVTKGIISALGRGELGIVDYEDFIQTDAPINPGNSGGPLVDIEGRLIGINQSIASRTGGNLGIGFAIPVNLARSIVERIVTDGAVRRGYLGINIQPVTAELATEFKLPDQDGVLVGGVQPGSAAGEAGLKAGDVIIAFNGKKVADPRHLRLVVSQTLPGVKAPVKFIRDGREKTVTVTLDALPSELAGNQPAGDDDAPGAAISTLNGLEFSDIDAKARKQFDVPDSVQGAIVTSVEPDSAAAQAGLKPGDVIVEMNHQAIDNSKDLRQSARAAAGKRLLLRVWSNAGAVSGTRFVILQPEAAKKP